MLIHISTISVGLNFIDVHLVVMHLCDGKLL